MPSEHVRCVLLTREGWKGAHRRKILLPASPHAVRKRGRERERERDRIRNANCANLGAQDAHQPLGMQVRLYRYILTKARDGIRAKSALAVVHGWKAALRNEGDAKFASSAWGVPTHGYLHTRTWKEKAEARLRRRNPVWKLRERESANVCESQPWKDGLHITIGVGWCGWRWRGEER